jgi:hypothetical protein
MKKFKITIWDALVFGALAALVWGKSAQTILLAVIAYLLYLLVRSQLSRPSAICCLSPAGVNHVVDCNWTACAYRVPSVPDLD